jgi:3-hydroxyacyl-CoA dehydrogenase
LNGIEKAAVIGAGVMGAGIAAHMANAGVKVVLLDRVDTEGAGDGNDRSAIARGAIQRLAKTDPAPLMLKRNAALITPGNTEDDLGLLSGCDWIVEAVIEDADIKRTLYRRIDEVRKPGAVVSSNTSTIPLGVLMDGMPEALRRDFLITHFFNPPRYMRLLELVAGPDTDPRVLDSIRRFADIRLGKGVVTCHDTPGFIANRIGIYWLQCAVVEALDAGLTVEEADAVLGRPAGIPKTGVFGLLDMVGLDLMPHVLGSLSEALPADDAFHRIYRKPELIERRIADGYTGRKGKGGFYRLKPDAPERIKQALDLATGEYRDARKPKLDSVAAARKGGLRALVSHPDAGGRYGWRVLSRTLGYAASLVPEIADDIAAVDEAMRLGYNWKHGPFELIDRLGTAWFADRLREEGATVPALVEMAAGRPFYRTHDGRSQYLTVEGEYRDVTRPDGVLRLADVKRRTKPIARNKSASLWDIGDGVVCLEFHSKMNSLNPLSLWMIKKAIRIVAERYKALVIYNEGSNFSVGANLGLVLIAARLRSWFVVRAMVRIGQDTYKALKYAPFPVVGAPSGMALGGGCEILLHCDAVQAHAETYTGLVEAGIGVVPAWGGCKEMLLRWWGKPGRPGGPMPPVIRVFETLGTAQVAKSAPEAKELLFLRAGDGITMNRDRLLADAKARAQALAAAGYRPPSETEIALPGPTALAAMSLAVDGLRIAGKATPHDAVVGTALAGVLSGGDTDITATVSEDELLGLERKAFMALVRHPATIARVQHMLKTGRPLRN